MKKYNVVHIKTGYIALTGTHQECLIWMVGNAQYQNEYTIKPEKK